MKLLKSALWVLLLSSVALTPALAKNEKHARDQRQERVEYSRDRDDHNDNFSEHPLRFDEQRAEHIRSYMREHHRNYCPPGLAKKHNGCRPPGQAKKSYRIGERLPSRHYEVPYNLLNEIGPPPRGAYYAMVDSDVLLVSEATKKILDAIVLFSAVK
jgi:Ni/Co efflux regulator RcnB